MKIRELSERTAVVPRLLRYYEQQGLLHPHRLENGYRDYDACAVDRVNQIRGLLAAGMTTEIIAGILPCLGSSSDLHFSNPDPEFLRRIERERDRMQERIDCLMKNKTALDDYLAELQPAAA